MKWISSDHFQIANTTARVRTLHSHAQSCVCVCVCDLIDQKTPLVCRDNVQKVFYVCRQKSILLRLRRKGIFLSVACTNSCGFKKNLEPPKYFYPQALEQMRF